MYANATLPEEFSASCCRQTASSKLKRRLELQLKWKYCAIHPNNSVSCVSLTTCSILRGTLVQKVSEKVERFRSPFYTFWKLRSGTNVEQHLRSEVGALH